MSRTSSCASAALLAFVRRRFRSTKRRRSSRATCACGNPQLVADDAGAIVGWCDVRARDHSRLRAHEAMLGMGLLPEYRGRGLGERLIAARSTPRRARGIRAHRAHRYMRATFVPRALYRKVGLRHRGHARARQEARRRDTTTCT